jgi:preprotein translocase subunit SecA
MYNESALLASVLHLYPEKENPLQESWLAKAEAYCAVFVEKLRANPWYLQRMVRRINDHAGRFDAMALPEIGEAARQLRRELRSGGFRPEHVAKAFALIRAASHLTIGMRHFESQLKGGLVLLKGMVAEMNTGEGKTLTATLASCTAALAGIPVHVVTVNDYLAKRDAEIMSPLFEALGLTVGVVQSGMEAPERQAAYRCDITYCTNKDIVFDYLRDRIVLRNQSSSMSLQMKKLYGNDASFNKLLLHGLPFAIVDEIDSVLVDEARTPLIISATVNSGEEIKILQQALDIAQKLELDRDFSIADHGTRIVLNERGRAAIERHAKPLSGVWNGALFRDETVSQALSALHLFRKDVHYLMRDGKVQIIDENTGRVMEDRSWERGLHQLIELKENCETTNRREPLARISYQRFFRRYLHLSGMSGTAQEVAGELGAVYGLPVVRIPSHKPNRRQYFPDHVFQTEEGKWQAIIDRIEELHKQGRPVMLGTRSVAASERASALLTERGLAHRVLNAKQDSEEADIVAMAGEIGRITVATSMAGRGTDIKISEEAEALGGLHVILSERYDSKRIDRQLEGRCARQGDPGSFESFLSLQDALVTVNWKGGRLRLLKQLLSLRILPLRWVGTAVIRGGQRKVEKMHARIRKDLLIIDDKMAQNLSFSGQQE